MNNDSKLVGRFSVNEDNGVKPSVGERVADFTRQGLEISRKKVTKTRIVLNNAKRVGMEITEFRRK